ncbi:serine--tRNA ligase [bacterium]|nr:serine--tRNA ligase [bacterium]
MLDIKLIREHPEEIKEGIRKKGVDPALVDEVLQLDKQRRKLIQEVEKIRAKKNLAESKLINIKEEEEKKKILTILKEAKAYLNYKEKELKDIEEKFWDKIRLIPNPPLPDVPEGKDETENKIIRKEGKITRFTFKPRDYLTIAEKLDIIDVQRAAKTSGSRFGFLKREGAILEIALVHYAFDKLAKRGFIPVIPPVMIKPKPFAAMGYLERGKEEVYYLEKDNLYLVGTAEQIIGPMHMGEIFAEQDLPLRYVAFSSCFRREAGSYGKDTKGILRVHQFDKVEMFIFSTPEKSEEEHQLLLSLEEEIMKELGIPYRVIFICSGDLGDPAAKKYDIEAWLPGQNNGEGQYRETHSTSNCTDYQARRLNIKYRTKEGTLNFLYTLNGTAIAVGRTIIAIIENYQTKEGWVRIPKVLWKYTNGLRIIRR